MRQIAPIVTKLNTYVPYLSKVIRMYDWRYLAPPHTTQPSTQTFAVPYGQALFAGPLRLRSVD